VDDLPANLLALEVLLDDLQQTLVKAGSGEEALRLLSRQDFAVVLLDVRMPGMDGFETAKRIRGREQSRNTPIIFITAHASDELSISEAFQLGAVDYLVKPLAPVIIRAKVGGFAKLYLEKAQARRQADELRLLIQGTTDYAIFRLDRQGYVRSWNPGAERMKGYKAEEIIGQHFSRFYPQEALDRGWPAEELRRAEAVGRFEDEGWRVRKDGSQFWANVVITALRDPAGRLLGFSKVTRDLTERKRAEDVLRRAHEELEVKVAERTKELTEANSRLADAARRKDEFLAMLAHELRNPLAPVLNGLHILGSFDTDHQTIKQARAMIERQIHHLKRLVDDLLDMARMTHGRVQLRRERLDLAQLVRTTAEDCRRLVEQAGMRLVVVLPEAVVPVVGDAIRLTQVLNNLLDNAVKFRNGGGYVAIHLSIDEGRQQAVLAVRDEGIGIEPEMFSRLFDLFGQADRSLDRSRGGLGLGLSLVKGLVELHGGEVQAVSGGTGQGSEFRICLPLKQEPAALSEPPSLTTPAAGEPLRILVVEDNVDAAESLRMLLQLLGHQVAVAFTGPEGVRVAKDWHPEVILCDIGLPGLDGYGVADALRHDPATAQVQLIAITGYGQDEDRHRAEHAGFDHHLTKPVDPRQLQPLLARRVSVA
jgi:PAS domain S-box-containing protein